MKLRLLGGPVEDYRCILIESDASELRHEAIEAHAAWLACPNDDAGLKEAYAHALRRWARETRNRRALLHAERLETEVRMLQRAAKDGG